MQNLALAIADVVVGTAWVGLGLAVVATRPRAVGLLMVATGVTWFVGDLGDPALFLHRGPLVHLLLCYPLARPRTRLELVVIVIAYVDAVAYPLGRTDGVTVALAIAVAVTALVGYVRATQRERRARVTGLAAAVVIMIVLGLGAAARLIGAPSDTATLWAYQLAVGAAAVVIFADLRWGRRHQAAITGLVVDLGEAEKAGVLADKLARALGDPSLVLGYWLPEADGYVDEAGRPVELPEGASGLATTVLEADGQRVGVLVHDAAVLGDPLLVESVAALARMAITNVRLQAEVRARVADIEASRRRIVEAADAERQRLEGLLQRGAMRRLARVADLLTADDPAELRLHVDASQLLLREFAHGVHPRALTESGLPVALAELADACRTPVELRIPSVRLPPTVEATAYFVCSEALANISKYAQAASARIVVNRNDDAVTVEITDDGVGGADPARGSGLHGLADRVAALGGAFLVDSRPGAGTRLTARIPCR